MNSAVIRGGSGGGKLWGLRKRGLFGGVRWGWGGRKARRGGGVGEGTEKRGAGSLKRMIALATVGRESAGVGTNLSMELTVEASRKTVSAKVVALPFFNPGRKTAAIGV